MDRKLLSFNCCPIKKYVLSLQLHDLNRRIKYTPVRTVFRARPNRSINHLVGNWNGYHHYYMPVIIYIYIYSCSVYGIYLCLPMTYTRPGPDCINRLPHVPIVLYTFIDDSVIPDTGVTLYRTHDMYIRMYCYCAFM